MPSVSVMIPSYRYGHLVAHCVESILSQTRKPEFILVVDDGARDCGHILEKYASVGLIQRPQNLGIVDNFNDILFNEVKTDKVIFVGADNWLHPEAIELMSAVDEDIVSCDAWLVGDGKYKRWTLPYQPHGSALYDVKKAREAGGYEPSGREHTEEDSMLFRKMIDKGATFHRVDKPLLYYRRHHMNFNK